MSRGFQCGMWKYLFIIMACVIMLCSAVLMWGIHFHLLTGQVWVSFKMLYFKYPKFLHMHKTVEMINIHNLQAIQTLDQILFKNMKLAIKYT